MADYDPNVAEAMDAWLMQWYRFTTQQMNNMITDHNFASFYEKYFLSGAEKNKR